MGKITNEFWRAIPTHFTNIALDEYIIMPNHIHGIIVGNETVGNADLRSLQTTDDPICTVAADDYDRTKMVLSKIIHGFKSSVTRETRRQLNNNNFAWQKSYYDHIIREDNDLHRIREYIINNPMSWDEDQENPGNKP